jgi:hypothetical protein
MNLANEMKDVTEFKIRKSVKDSRAIVTEEIRKVAESHKYQFEYSFPSFFTHSDKISLNEYLVSEGFNTEFLDETKILLISWDV